MKADEVPETDVAVRFENLLKSGELSSIPLLRVYSRLLVLLDRRIHRRRRQTTAVEEGKRVAPAAEVTDVSMSSNS